MSEIDKNKMVYRKPMKRTVECDVPFTTVPFKPLSEK